MKKSTKQTGRKQKLAAAERATAAFDAKVAQLYDILAEGRNKLDAPTMTLCWEIEMLAPKRLLKAA